MDIKILDSWLREYLETNAKPKELARAMSLSGPSFEKTTKTKRGGKTDFIYDVEVTTNRVDLMSIYGLAREATVILPEYGYKAKLRKIKKEEIKTPKSTLPFSVKTKKKLTTRVMGIVLENIKNKKTPSWMKERLEATGIRSLGALVDITNYVMTEVGHPTHVFDYDRIKSHKFKIRESEKSEKIVSLEGKEYELPGGDIVIDDSRGEIIDLPGIIGTKNSVVTKDTKRIIFFLETNNPVKIRKTSMTLGIRTVAATLNEKGVDPELAETALMRGVQLYKKVCSASPASDTVDTYYPNKETKAITVRHEKIESYLGTKVEQKRVEKILKRLDFEVSVKKTIYKVAPPSFRKADINIPEDIIEEVARIYGYHNLPSRLMTGSIPEDRPQTPFGFEIKAKRTLKALKGNEVYTYSMVKKEYVKKSALRLKNPLGKDSEYMRDSLMPSLIEAADQNKGEKAPFFLFEMANVYVPKKKRLPEEKMMLGVIFSNYSYRKAKGVVEAFLAEVNIEAKFEARDKRGYSKSHRIEIRTKEEKLGSFGQLKNGYLYWEMDMQKLHAAHTPIMPFRQIPPYPPQIEDITFTLKAGIKVADIIETIKDTDQRIANCELVDIYEANYTLRIYYQDPEKTLEDQEVARLRKKMLKQVAKGFGVRVEDQ